MSHMPSSDILLYKDNVFFLLTGCCEDFLLLIMRLVLLEKWYQELLKSEHPDVRKITFSEPQLTELNKDSETCAELIIGDL